MKSCCHWGDEPQFACSGKKQCQVCATQVWDTRLDESLIPRNFRTWWRGLVNSSELSHMALVKERETNLLTTETLS